jgi:sugar lactone lactonase YvrE/4-amino-4-deoxy-L-arabinose transferase-like glycosyltransferase
VTVWDRIDLPAPWFWLVANSIRIGDHMLASLRLPAALFGAAAVVPLYFLVRAEWGRLAALSGAVVLAASAVALQYSRTTINNIVTPFFWSVCFLFLLRAIRTRRPLNWALAGLAAGLSEYGYYGTHLLPFVLGGFFVYLLLTRRQQGRHLLTGFGTLALGYLVGFGPLLAYFVRFRPDVYFGRGSAEGVLMWNHVPRDLADAQLMWSTLSPLVVENLLGFNTHGGQDSFYWAPLLPASETALLVIGVALLIWQWRRPAAFLMLLSGFGVLFVGGTLIHGVPYFAHWTPAFPAIYAAIAVVVGTWASQWRGIRAKWRRLGPAAVMVGLSVNVVSNVDFYFNRYVVPRPEFELRAAQSRWEADLGTAYQVYTAGKTWQPYDAEVNGYLIHGQQGAALDQPERQLPLLDAPGKGLGFVFLPDNEPYQGLVATVYPGGTWGEVRSHTGSHLFNTYVIALAGQPAEVTTGQSAGAAPHLTLSATGREVTLRPTTLVKPAAILGAGAGLNGPRALAVSSTGDLLVADTGNQRVVRLDARGTVIADVPGAFELPAAVGIASNDQLLTVDGRTGMLQGFSPEGRLVLSAQLGTSNANGLAVDRAGRFWVADTTNNRVARYSPDGQLEAELRGGAQPPDRFEQPIAVALGPDGTLFVADLRGRIVELDDQGLVRREWPVQIGTGRGVSQLLVWRGQLLLTDPERHRLELLDPNTGELRTIGEPGIEPGQFRRPLGLATDAADRLYVVDSDNARIQVFTTLDQP